MSMGGRSLMGLVLAGAVLWAAGCSSGSAELLDLNRRLTSIDLISKNEPDATYVVEPPDQILVEFVTDESLTRSVTLRSDGCVTLPHLEDVKVAGLTSMEIRRKLEELYEKYYKEPRILVPQAGRGGLP